MVAQPPPTHPSYVRKTLPRNTTKLGTVGSGNRVFPWGLSVCERRWIMIWEGKSWIFSRERVVRRRVSKRGERFVLYEAVIGLRGVVSVIDLSGNQGFLLGAWFEAQDRGRGVAQDVLRSF